MTPHAANVRNNACAHALLVCHDGLHATQNRGYFVPRHLALRTYRQQPETPDSPAAALLLPHPLPRELEQARPRAPSCRQNPPDSLESSRASELQITHPPPLLGCVVEQARSCASSRAALAERASISVPRITRRVVHLQR
jgi:hypothetical protein